MQIHFNEQRTRPDHPLRMERRQARLCRAERDFLRVLVLAMVIAIVLTVACLW